MIPRWIQFASAAVLGIGCSPGDPPPAVSSAPAAPEPQSSEPAPPAAPPFVSYQIVQATPVELLFDEVFLDPTSSRCFKAHRRQMGALDFAAGSDEIVRSAYATEIDHAVKVWKEGSRKGAKPTIVLHGYADAHEVDTPAAAQDLSQRRAETVKAWLVERGVAASQLRIEAHGALLSSHPIVPNTLLPLHSRVEISHDSAPPSEATLTEASPVHPDVLRQLQQKARSLAASTTSGADSKHAPHVVISLRDSEGVFQVALHVASASPDAIPLHRYFMAGLSGNCAFGTPP